MKFVIRSKLQDLGGDQSAAVDEKQPSSIPATDPSDASKPPAVRSDEVVDNEKKRKRNERDTVPMATKKVLSEIAWFVDVRS